MSTKGTDDTTETAKKAETGEKNQATVSRHGVSTNIKDFWVKQKEKAKRIPSKTPEKNKGSKIQKTKKVN